ncbi:MAG TPA: MptD family putative ECF transporter S component [Candidatus Stercoripulliclostridium merdipullorum]|uniref:MptD family putative ECF transporter S component n=1 Tax=Candidatus Stercoripulliclostridium merdipullorum TaxID=2840952 RepID=A0A9D1NC14_9FIRM|nr:MptD family putative ECF transporter S component [Candidatus Stercoripulliclostridium merdipullorum]
MLKEQGCKNAIQDPAQALLENTAEIMRYKQQVAAARDEAHESAERGVRIFRKYKIKDIVFLAIMAACMLVTGAIMPLITQVPLFGIIELCLGLQFSVFPVIGMMKVRKPFALILISLFCGIFFAFMFLPMFVCAMVCAIIVEALVLLIFRGYAKDAACVFAGTLYMPMTLPFLYLWYNVIYSVNPAEDGKAVQAFVGADPRVAVGISVAVVAVCFVGSLIGMLVSRELKKAGVLKK